MNMKYRTLTILSLVVALIVGTVAQSLVRLILTPGPGAEFVGLVAFIGGVAGGLFGFVGFFRVREGKPFFPKIF